MFNWVYHLVPFYFKEKDSVHLTLAKKQISSFLHPRLRGEDGFSSKYPSTFAPSFLQKHFKNKVHESNLYEIGMRVPIHLVKKKHMKKGAYLVPTGVAITDKGLIILTILLLLTN